MLTFVVTYVILGLITAYLVNLVVHYGKCVPCVVWITLLWPGFWCATVFLLSMFVYMYLERKTKGYG